jgi:hypothetical protein
VKSALTPPAVRFIRCYDVSTSRMLNVWQSLSTQEQIDNAPLATEFTVTEKTVDEAMIEIRKWKNKCWVPETIDEIEKASRTLIPAQPSFYGVRNA